MGSQSDDKQLQPLDVKAESEKVKIQLEHCKRELEFILGRLRETEKENAVLKEYMMTFLIDWLTVQKNRCEAQINSILRLAQQ